MNTLCLNEKYSTTRLLITEKPAINNKPEDKFETVLFLPENNEKRGEGGLRTKGYYKKSYEDKPLISIVTVVFNGEKYLEQTILSVIDQSYENVEYIIIDGGSTDGTVEIIKKYEDQIDYWVSEPDNGIYDAMNKSIKICLGEWVNFMNAGDYFFDTWTLANVVNGSMGSKCGLIYGDTEMRYQTFSRRRKAASVNNIHQGMPFGHQSMFVRTKIHRGQEYNMKYTICADYNFVCSLYKKGIIFKQIDSVLSSCSVGGLSDVQEERRTDQIAEIAYKHFPKSAVKFFHRKNIIKNKIKVFFKKQLPPSMVELIKRLK